MVQELISDESILSQPTAPVTAEDAALVADLRETLESLDDAACLSANQIGVAKAAGVWRDDKNKVHELLNPKILMGLHPSLVVEGCLSREEPSQVKRFAQVKVQFEELVDGALKRKTRDFRGWEAQLVQHMIDHNAGKLV